MNAIFKAILRPATSAPLSHFSHHNVVYAPRFLLPTSSTSSRFAPLPAPPRTLHGWRVDRSGDAIIRDGELYVDADGDEKMPMVNSEEEVEGEEIEMSEEKIFGVKEMLASLPPTSTAQHTAAAAGPSTIAAPHATLATHWGATGPPSLPSYHQPPPSALIISPQPSTHYAAGPSSMSPPAAAPIQTAVTRSTVPTTHAPPATAPPTSAAPINAFTVASQPVPATNTTTNALAPAANATSNTITIHSITATVVSTQPVSASIGPWSMAKLMAALDTVEKTPYVNMGESSKARIRKKPIGGIDDFPATPRYESSEPVWFPASVGGWLPKSYGRCGVFGWSDSVEGVKGEVVGQDAMWGLDDLKRDLAQAEAMPHIDRGTKSQARLEREEEGMTLRVRRSPEARYVPDVKVRLPTLTSGSSHSRIAALSAGQAAGQVTQTSGTEVTDGASDVSSPVAVGSTDRATPLAGASTLASTMHNSLPKEPRKSSRSLVLGRGLTAEELLAERGDANEGKGKRKVGDGEDRQGGDRKRLAVRASSGEEGSDDLPYLPSGSAVRQPLKLASSLAPAQRQPSVGASLPAPLAPAPRQPSVGVSLRAPLAPAPRQPSVGASLPVMASLFTTPVPAASASAPAPITASAPSSNPAPEADATPQDPRSFAPRNRPAQPVVRPSTSAFSTPATATGDAGPPAAISAASASAAAVAASPASGPTLLDDNSAVTDEADPSQSGNTESEVQSDTGDVASAVKNDYAHIFDADSDDDDDVDIEKMRALRRACDDEEGEEGEEVVSGGEANGEDDLGGTPAEDNDTGDGNAGEESEASLPPFEPVWLPLITVDLPDYTGRYLYWKPFTEATSDALWFGGEGHVALRGDVTGWCQALEGMVREEWGLSKVLGMEIKAEGIDTLVVNNLPSQIATVDLQTFFTALQIDARSTTLRLSLSWNFDSPKRPPGFHIGTSDDEDAGMSVTQRRLRRHGHSQGHSKARGSVGGRTFASKSAAGSTARNDDVDVREDDGDRRRKVSSRSLEEMMAGLGSSSTETKPSGSGSDGMEVEEPARHARAKRIRR